MANTSEEQPRPEIDMAWVARLFPPAMLLATKQQHDDTMQLESHLADHVRDALVKEIPLPLDQRDQIQLELSPSQFAHIYLVNYVRPGNDPEHPLPAFCVREDDGTWKVNIVESTAWFQQFADAGGSAKANQEEGENQQEGDKPE